MIMTSAARVAYANRHIFQNNEPILVLECFALYQLLPDDAVTMFAFIAVHVCHS